MAATDTVSEMEEISEREGVYQVIENSETLTSEYRMTEADLEPMRQGKVKVVLGDIVWGMTLCTSVAALSYLIGRWLQHA